MNRLTLFALAASITLAACSKKEEVAAVPPPSAAAAHAAPAGGGAGNSGKALQVLQAAGYTYAEVEMGGQKVWLAGGAIEAKVGDTLQWGEYSTMRNFNAKSLGRTFDQILFVDNWGPAGGAPAQLGMHGGLPPQHPPLPQDNPTGAPGANQGEVKSVATAGGYTYLEVVQGGAPVWLAVAETPVKVGDKVSWDGGATMKNFNAKSLGRTFDQIIFAGAVTVLK